MIKFLEDDFAALYASERRLSILICLFTVLAIGIARAGLVGLASFMAVRRRKEIGIRKVLGASVSGIFVLVSREYLLLIAVANVIAWPAARFAGENLLQNFAYRTENDVTMLLFAGVVTLLVALLTVSGQALRAAGTNPTASLREE